MIPAWLVVRKERHVDDRFWVCLSREDALIIARDVAAYWRAYYEPSPEDLDTNLYETLIFNENADCSDRYWVYAMPIMAREAGETRAVTL